MGLRLGRDIALSRLRQDYDAVFLGIGLGGVNALGIAEPIMTIAYRGGQERIGASWKEQSWAAAFASTSVRWRCGNHEVATDGCNID